MAMKECVFCKVEPVVKKTLKGRYIFIQCPVCKFATGGFYGEQRELEHWNKCNRQRPAQLSLLDFERRKNNDTSR